MPSMKKEWAGVLAKLTLSMGRIQCIEISLHKVWPSVTEYRTWYSIIFGLDGADAMERMKFSVVKNHPELVPYIRYWDEYPPKVP